MSPREELKKFESVVLDAIFFIITEGQRLFFPASCFTPIYLFLFVKTWSAFHHVLLTWSLLEILMFLYSYFKISSFESIFKNRELVPENPVAFANKMLEHEPRILQVLKGWLKNPDTNLSRVHLSYWIAWFFFFKNVGDLDFTESSQRAEIENLFVKKILKDSQLEDGNSICLELKETQVSTIPDNNPCFRPSLDPVPYQPRPLIFYGVKLIVFS